MITAQVTEMRYLHPGEHDPYRVEPMLLIVRQPWYAALVDELVSRPWFRRVPLLRRRRVPLISWWYELTHDTTDLVPLTEERACELETFLPSVRKSCPTWVRRGVDEEHR